MARTGPLLTPFWVPHSVLLWLFVGVGGRWEEAPATSAPPPPGPSPGDWASSEAPLPEE